MVVKSGNHALAKTKNGKTVLHVSNHACVREENIMLTSIGVNGPGRFHHCRQFFRADRPRDTHVEARANSELFLLLGNRGDTSTVTTLHPKNIRLFGQTEVMLPFDSKTHLRLSIVDPTRKASIRVVSGDETRWLILGSKHLLTQEGVNIGISWEYPNPFPADGPRKDIIIVGTEEYLDQQFYGLADVSTFDIAGDYSFVAGINTGMKNRDLDGYVYLITHPNFHEWVKVGSTTNLKDRLCSYQTSDPLRRFEIQRFYAVDNRVAVERWVRHLAAQQNLIVQGEWINCSISKALRLTEEALDLINAGA